ncbi:acyltransferase [Paenibacillus elgii]|uniref:acyltransferase n=1 Tax=Paenibacillus elgii TaxID=189691 RepID=UPI000FDCCD0D|nr:acyltransferase [Paenibacillus elgii]NEN84299.1 N-acetyltransferase [Paenibacillus elgii]
MNLKNVFIHKNAIVETNKVGENTKIWAFAHILSGATIGANCNICDQTFIENDVIIGDNVTIKCGVYIWDGVRLGSNVFVGPNVTFTNDLKPRSKRYPDSFAITTIHEGASIGANATIIAGNTIGRYAMIGAGAVVTKSVPDHTLWYGNPARFRGYICECGEALLPSFKCSSCDIVYENNQGKITKVTL